MKLTRDKIQRMVGSQGLVGSGAAGGGGTIGVTEQRVMEILQDYETIDALETTLENYVTTTALETTLANYATKTYVDQNYLSLSFFNALFQARTSQGATVAPNSGDTTTIDNIKAMFGFWTDQYISALGQGADGGAITSLAALTDVQLSMPLADGEVLTYSTTLGKWTNGAGVSTAWANITGKPTTIAGYGITDAHITNGTITLGANTITPITSLSGYATQTWVQQQGYVTSSGVTSVATGTGLTGGTITSTGTISINSTYQTYISNGNTAYGYFTDGVANKAACLDINSPAITTQEALDSFHEKNKVKVGVSRFIATGIPSDCFIIDGGWITDVNFGFQIAIDDDPTYKMYIRQRNTNGWAAWKQIPIGDGTGASGTWGISITGSAATLTTSRTLWGQSFNGSANVSGNMTDVGNITMAAIDGTYIQLGDIRIVYDSTNTALKVVKSDGTTAANFYATGAISALGQGVDGGGGGQGDVTWALLASNSDTRQIALSHLTTALSGYALTSQIPTNNNQLTNGAGYITSTGSCASLINKAISAQNDGVPSLDRFQTFRTSASDTGWADGYIMSFAWSNGSYCTQLFLDVDDTYGFAIRYRNSSGTWASWKKIITEANIGSQSVAYATSAGTATDSTKLPLTGGTLSTSNREVLALNTSNSSGPQLGFYKNDTSNGRIVANGTSIYLINSQGKECAVTTNGLQYSPNGTTYYDVALAKDIPTDNNQLANGAGYYKSGDNITANHIYLSGYLYLKDNSNTWISTIDHSGNSPIFGYEQGTKGYNVYYTGRNVYINGGSTYNSTNGLVITADNNIAIGRASAKTKFDLNGGQAKFGYGTGSASINSSVNALVIGPQSARANTTYYPGIAFCHLLNYNSTDDYINAPQAWIGLRKYDTPGSERSYLVFATKEGTGTTDSGTDIPTQRMCIDPFGKVGIATATPSYTLHVDGDIYATGNGYFTGNVGIGTTSPSYKLHVAGDICSSTGAYLGKVRVGINSSGSSDSDACIEMMAGTGYIDWHYNGSSSDYTTRLIENASGQLYLYGNFVASGGVTALSDARHKAVIKDTPITVEQIAQMPAVLFRWNDEHHDHNTIYAGTLAQDWESVLPQVVSIENNSERTRNFAYGVAALISAITTARTVVDHEKRITELEKECADWREAYNTLRMDYEQLKLKVA